MGKQGPCYHCGVTNTPLWRNGPPDKPVLCNACGSRWRTKGSLVNYIPLHARADRGDYEDPRVTKAKVLSLKKSDENLKKIKHSYESTSLGKYASDFSQGFQKRLDEDSRNRSSSGSVLSNSESYPQFSADASDLTGSSQSIAWEAQVPSRKRTRMSRPKPSSVEKLTQDLCAILHEQQSSYLSGTTEEELLFDSDTPMVSVEIGHGSVLMKHPSSLAREEESEASSVSVENKPRGLNETYSYSKKYSNQQEEPAKREKSIHDKMQLLWNHNSPLCGIDLDDVISFDVLFGHFTREEQQQLLKYLPSSDTSQFPGSLRNMFDSSFFKENISSFQELISEGVFSDSISGVKAEEFKELKKLVVSTESKSKWLDLYKKLKDSKYTDGTGEHGLALGIESTLSKSLGSCKKSQEEVIKKMAGTRATLKSPKRTLLKARPAFKSPSETRHLMLTPPHSDQDLLLSVPSNGILPQAELLPVSGSVPSGKC